MARKAKTYKFTETTIESIRVKLEDLNEGKRIQDEEEISETAFLEMLINDFDVHHYRFATQLAIQVTIQKRASAFCYFWR